MAEDAVSASAKGATFLILLQIGSRAVTFALNQVLLSFLSPELLGAGVQLELLIISTLYFARESLRIAAQRRSDGGVQAAINVSYLAIAAGLPFGAVFAHLYLSNNPLDVPYFVTAVRMCQMTAVIELVSEPAFVAVQQHMLYKTRAAAEAAAVVAKTIATAALVVWARYNHIDLGVLPFAVGEMSYSGTLTLVYLWRTLPVARSLGFQLLPIRNPSSSKYILSLFEKSLLSLAASLYVQTGIKWLLTEGDKLLIAALASLEDQGMYAVSANYGGLIARMVFRPIEDSSRNLFADLCSARTVSQQPASLQPELAKQDAMQNDRLRRAASILANVLKVYNVASLIAFAIGPSAAPLLLELVAGRKWIGSGAGDVLATYCYCIPLLAINGVSEAFVSATASTKELRYQSICMGFFSAGFAASAYVFLRVMQMGAKGLVLANCVNMTLRIIFNVNYASRFFAEHQVDFALLHTLPNIYSVAVTAVVPSALVQTSSWWSKYGLFGQLAHVGTVGGVFVVAIVVSERKFLLECYRSNFASKKKEPTMTAPKEKK